jgi:hypothetical protein
MVRFRSMRRPPPVRFWAALLTLVLVVVLRPLAQASPADPLWIAGFYDGADFDDVVSFLATYSGVDTARLAIHRPAPRIPETLAEVRDRSTGTADRPSTLTRAPPPSFAPPV